jgi:hypothetical protein
MPQSTVASKVHEALNIHGDLGPEVALNLVMRVYDLPDGIHLSVRQVIALGVPADACLIENLLRSGPPNTIYIGQSDLDAFILG